jgi:hypothetical protein
MALRECGISHIFFLASKKFLIHRVADSSDVGDMGKILSRKADGRTWDLGRGARREGGESDHRRALRRKQSTNKDLGLEKVMVEKVPRSSSVLDRSKSRNPSQF